jgi:hypothetical protein
MVSSTKRPADLREQIERVNRINWAARAVKGEDVDFRHVIRRMPLAVRSQTCLLSWPNPFPSVALVRPKMLPFIAAVVCISLAGLVKSTDVASPLLKRSIQPGLAGNAAWDGSTYRCPAGSNIFLESWCCPDGYAYDTTSGQFTSYICCPVGMILTPFRIDPEADAGPQAVQIVRHRCWPVRSAPIQVGRTGTSEAPTYHLSCHSAASRAMHRRTCKRRNLPMSARPEPTCSQTMPR